MSICLFFIAHRRLKKNSPRTNGHTTARRVNRRFLSTKARVHSQGSQCVIYVGQNVTLANFSPCIPVLPVIVSPPMSHLNHLSFP
jgi:hypothetical protein